MCVCVCLLLYFIFVSSSKLPSKQFFIPVSGCCISIYFHFVKFVQAADWLSALENRRPFSHLAPCRGFRLESILSCCGDCNGIALSSFMHLRAAERLEGAFSVLLGTLIGT